VYVKPGKYYENLFSEEYNENLFSEDYDEDLFSEDFNGVLFRRGVNHRIEGELSPCLPSLIRLTSLTDRST
jgi:hypothetical protein